jgi:hypothetical protein
MHLPALISPVWSRDLRENGGKRRIGVQKRKKERNRRKYGKKERHARRACPMHLVTVK